MSRSPDQPKLYHIVHVDRLASIVADGCLSCDAEMARREAVGTTIGMSDIKRRRLHELFLSSRPGLRVGECVPFYFCPRSVMLYIIAKANHANLGYRGGQEPIIHLEADLHRVVEWAEENGIRWAFTLSNAGARYFEDRCRLDALSEVNWDAVNASAWSGSGVLPSVKDGKQAEFLVERQLPWHLIERLGVASAQMVRRATLAIAGAEHRPQIEVRNDWYY
jgi:hypothetical protein